MVSRRQVGPSGSWYLPHLGGGRQDIGEHVSSDSVVRQHQSYTPYESFGSFGFRGEPEYPRRSRWATESRGYPTLREWDSRRPQGRRRYETVPLGVRGINYGPGDFDWFDRQHRAGWYGNEPSGPGQHFYDPPEGAPARDSMWGDGYWWRDPMHHVPEPEWRRRNGLG